MRILNLRSHLQAREYHHRFRKMSAVTLIIITSTLALVSTGIYHEIVGFCDSLSSTKISHMIEYLIFFEDI